MSSLKCASKGVMFKYWNELAACKVYINVYICVMWLKWWNACNGMTYWLCIMWYLYDIVIKGGWVGYVNIYCNIVTLLYVWWGYSRWYCVIFNHTIYYRKEIS